MIVKQRVHCVGHSDWNDLLSDIKFLLFYWNPVIFYCLLFFFFFLWTNIHFFHMYAKYAVIAIFYRHTSTVVLTSETRKSSCRPSEGESSCTGHFLQIIPRKLRFDYGDLYGSQGKACCIISNSRLDTRCCDREGRRNTFVYKPGEYVRYVFLRPLPFCSKNLFAIRS